MTAFLVPHIYLHVSGLRDLTLTCLISLRFLYPEGRDLEHPFLAPILSRLPNDVGFKADEGGMMLSLNDNGAEAEYSAVELVAMILSSAQV